MRIERRFLQWGVFLIALGSLPLATELGWLDRNTIGAAGRLWPLLFVAVGFSILVARTRIAVLGALISASTFGLLFGIGVAGGLGSIGCIGADQQATTGQTARGSFGPQAEVGLTLNCGNLTVATTQGSAWTFSEAPGPSRAALVDAGSNSLHIANRGDSFLDFGASRPSWKLDLPADSSLDLSIQVNAGNAAIVLAGARLNSLSLTSNAGSVNVDLSEAAAIASFDDTVNAGEALVRLPASSLSGSVTVNAGRIGLCLPTGANLVVDVSGVLSNNNFASRGLVQDGDTWRNFNAASNLTAQPVGLHVTANAGTIELNPDGGCE